ncbi:MAG: serine hydrolase domain-containing protein, partial [Caulobacterales bacterium]
FSTTKPIAALMIARLVDQGRLDYEKPLAEIWPDFAQNGKERVTLGQAMSHQAGVAAFVEPIDPKDWFDPPKLAADLARVAPLWPLGTASGYHAMTFAPLAAEPARLADPQGRSIGVQLAEDLCAPFDIDFRIGRAASEAHRIADLKLPPAAADLGELTDLKRAVFMTRWGAPRGETPEWRDAEIPSANGHGTAAAVAKLYSIYANGGRIGGKQFISPGAYEALTRTRIEGPELVLPYDIHWAAGIMRNNALKVGPNPDALGHGGRGGSVGMADPDRRMSAAYVMNKMSPALVGDARWERLVAALYACL